MFLPFLFLEDHLFRSVYAVPEDDLSFPEFREAKVTYGIFAYDALGSPLSYVLLTKHWITRVSLEIFFTLCLEYCCTLTF